MSPPQTSYAISLRHSPSNSRATASEYSPSILSLSLVFVYAVFQYRLYYIITPEYATFYAPARVDYGAPSYYSTILCREIGWTVAEQYDFSAFRSQTSSEKREAGPTSSEAPSNCERPTTKSYYYHRSMLAVLGARSATKHRNNILLSHNTDLSTHNILSEYMN
jgi:hypothetical protein